MTPTRWQARTAAARAATLGALGGCVLLLCYTSTPVSADLEATSCTSPGYDNISNYDNSREEASKKITFLDLLWLR